MEVKDLRQNYANAFNCKNCPGNNGPEGCPLWWETVQTNVQTGEERLVKGCGLQQLPIWLIEVLKASNHAAASVQQSRNDIISGLNQAIAAAVKVKAGEKAVSGWKKLLKLPGGG